ncbi:MAG: hypothetical protein J2P23_14045 [Microlunatus sp.]|nr:hypothetical protein [Microlunatus sp.]
MNGRNIRPVGGHVAAIAPVEPATTTNPVTIAARGPHSHRTTATTRSRILMRHLPVRAQLNKAVSSRMQLSASKSGAMLYRR